MKNLKHFAISAIVFGATLFLVVPAFAQIAQTSDSPATNVAKERSDSTIKDEINTVASGPAVAHESISVTNTNKWAAGLFRADSPRVPQTTNGPKWRFENSPYLWMAAMDGTVRVANNTVQVESSFSGILEQLDFAFANQFEAFRGRWGIFIDENYVNLGTTGTGPLGQTTEVEPTLNFFEAAASYAVATVPNEDSTDADPLPPVFTLEALGGIRHTHFGLELERPNLTAEGSRNLFDGFGGFRFKGRPHPAVTLSSRATFGGGGTEFTWTLNGLVDIRFRKNMSVWFGYQVMDIKSDQPSNRIGADVQMRGFITGLKMYFQK